LRHDRYNHGAGPRRGSEEEKEGMKTEEGRSDLMDKGGATAERWVAPTNVVDQASAVDLGLEPQPRNRAPALVVRSGQDDHDRPSGSTDQWAHGPHVHLGPPTVSRAKGSSKQSPLSARTTETPSSVPLAPGQNPWPDGPDIGITDPIRSSQPVADSQA